MAIVELQFPCLAAAIPSDHGYLLYSAISRLVPEVHSADWIAIATIPGMATGTGLTVTSSGAVMRLRLPVERVGLLSHLAGKTLDLKGCALALEEPRLVVLSPSPRLDARIVTIRGYTDTAPFLDAVGRKLDCLSIVADVIPGPRRVVRIASRTVVGFALSLRGLNERDSLTLQETGIGGRRRVGCGILIPSSPPTSLVE